jgi:tetratricopeptide (TPR) repeat protein
MLTAAGLGKDALAIGPGWCAALFTKGFTLVDQQQVELGLPFLKRAVEMRPDYAHYLNELAYAYGTLGQWPEALEAYGRAADAADPTQGIIEKTERIRAWRGMGYVLVEQGKWEEAAETYRKCLKLDPNDAKAKAELEYIARVRPKPS